MTRALTEWQVRAARSLPFGVLRLEQAPSGNSRFRLLRTGGVSVQLPGVRSVVDTCLRPSRGVAILDRMEAWCDAAPSVSLRSRDVASFKYQYKQAVEDARVVGDEVHEVVFADWSNGQLIDGSVPRRLAAYGAALLAWAETQAVNPVPGSAERLTCNAAAGYAGRIDCCVARDDGEVFVVEMKTTSPEEVRRRPGRHLDHHFQAALLGAAERSCGTQVAGSRLLYLGDDGSWLDVPVDIDGIDPEAVLSWYRMRSRVRDRLRTAMHGRAVTYGSGCERTAELVRRLVATDDFDADGAVVPDTRLPSERISDGELWTAVVDEEFEDLDSWD